MTKALNIPLFTIENKDFNKAGAEAIKSGTHFCQRCHTKTYALIGEKARELDCRLVLTGEEYSGMFFYRKPDDHRIMYCRTPRKGLVDGIQIIHHPFGMWVSEFPFIFYLAQLALTKNEIRKLIEGIPVRLQKYNVGCFFKQFHVKKLIHDRLGYNSGCDFLQIYMLEGILTSLKDVIDYLRKNETLYLNPDEVATRLGVKEQYLNFSECSLRDPRGDQILKEELLWRTYINVSSLAEQIKSLNEIRTLKDVQEIGLGLIRLFQTFKWQDGFDEGDIINLLREKDLSEIRKVSGRLEKKYRQLADEVNPLKNYNN